jgi:hypothetical protein
MGREYVRFALERPGHYRILFGTATPHKGGAVKPGERKEGPGGDAFEDLVRATARCLKDDVDPLGVALQIWAGLHGFVSLRAVMPGFDWPATEVFLTQLYTAHVGA